MALSTQEMNDLAYDAMQNAMDMCNQVAPDQIDSCIAAISEDVAPYGTFLVNPTTGEIELTVADIPDDIISALDPTIMPLGCTDPEAINYDPTATISGLCQYDDTSDGMLDNLMAEQNKPLLIIGGVIAVFLAIKLLK